MNVSNSKQSIVEFTILILLILFSILALVLLFITKGAQSEKELHIYKIVTRLEAKNNIERATANIIHRLQEAPFSISFNAFPSQESPSHLVSELPKFNLKTHYKNDMYLYTAIDIIDSSSKINVTQDEKSLYTLLENFIKIKENQSLWKIFELKTSGKITSLISLMQLFNFEQRKLIKDFFTVDSISTNKIVGPSPLEERATIHKIGDNIYSLSDLIPKSIKFLKKAYININTAKLEVIYSLLNEISGMYLSNIILDIPESEKDNLTPIGRLIKVEINSEEALSLSKRIMEYKEKSPIKSWNEFRTILKDNNLSEEKIDLILTNLNPNSNLNFFYPPHPLFKRMNKIDMINYTTEISFSPTGVFEFDVKVILAKKDGKLAEHSVYQIRKIFDLVEVVNQNEFARHFVNLNNQNTLDIYPLDLEVSQLVDFDGFVARSNLRTPQIDNRMLLFDASSNLSKLASDPKYKIYNIVDNNNNNNLFKETQIKGISIDLTKTKEGFILDAKRQYLIASSNIFHTKNKIIEENNIYCTLANPLPNKKFDFENEGYVSIWFRSLDDISRKYLITLSNMADIWSDRFARISFKTSFSNPLIEYGGGSSLKYIFKDENKILPKDIWFRIKSRWKIIKNNKDSSIEFYLDNKKLNIEYFKNLNKLPISSFFGLPNYKIFSAGISIGYGEYEPGYPYFFGLFDNLIISPIPIPDQKFKYNNNEDKLTLEVMPNKRIPLFISSSIYNGNISIYCNENPVFRAGGNFFIFQLKSLPKDKLFIDFKFNQKNNEVGQTEIIDDIFIALVNITTLASAVLLD